MFWWMQRNFKIKIGSWINSMHNYYGVNIPCEVDRIYVRGDSKYCRAFFDFNGINKIINVKLSSCHLDKFHYFNGK